MRLRSNAGFRNINDLALRADREWCGRCEGPSRSIAPMICGWTATAATRRALNFAFRLQPALCRGSRVYGRSPPLIPRRTRKLTALGDALSNSIIFTRDAREPCSSMAVPCRSPAARPTIANTDLIEAFGLDLNDVITLDQTNGTLPAADLFGGNGNDILTGGSNGDILNGDAGVDTLLGQGRDRPAVRRRRRRHAGRRRRQRHHVRRGRQRPDDLESGRRQ